MKPVLKTYFNKIRLNSKSHRQNEEVFMLKQLLKYGNSS